MFSLYLTLKFIHVAAVIFWIGGITTMTIWTLRAGRESEPTALAVIIRNAILHAQQVVGPSSGVVLLAGIGMVLSGHIPFSTFWVLWGFAGIVLHIALGVTVLRTNSARLAQLASTPTPDRAALGALLKRQKMLATIYLLTMFSVIWAMVTKPTL